MSYRRGKAKSCTGLMILVGLASRLYGLTVREMMQEAKVSERAVFRGITSLERMGVQIHRQREPVRGSWRIIYRLTGIRGLRFKVERPC